MVAKADTRMTILMNRELKQQAQMIFVELGMDMSTAITIFFRQAMSYKGFPFEVVLQTPNDETFATMEVSETN